MVFSGAYFRGNFAFKGMEGGGLIRGENFICVFKWAGTANKKGYKHSKPTVLHSLILGFHVTSPNSRIQNWEAYKIFTFIQGKIN